MTLLCFRTGDNKLSQETNLNQTNFLRGRGAGHIQVKYISAASPEEVFAFYESRGIDQMVSYTHFDIPLSKLALSSSWYKVRQPVKG